MEIQETLTQFIQSGPVGIVATANLANLPNMYISQLGVREAVWTEAKNYDSPTAPYLSTSEYF